VRLEPRLAACRPFFFYFFIFIKTVEPEAEGEEEAGLLLLFQRSEQRLDCVLVFRFRGSGGI
jgi:hypothetical protein